MEHLLTVVFTFSYFLAFAIGFYFGQKSIKLVGHRRETIQTGPHTLVERLTPEAPPPAGAIYHEAEMSPAFGVSVPERYKYGGDDE